MKPEHDLFFDLYRQFRKMNRRLTDWQKFLLEDMSLYSLAFFINLFWDCFFNLFGWAGLVVNYERRAGHPFNYGILQVLAMLFCVIQIFRKSRRWNDLAWMSYSNPGYSNK